MPSASPHSFLLQRSELPSISLASCLHPREQHVHLDSPFAASSCITLHGGFPVRMRRPCGGNLRGERHHCRRGWSDGPRPTVTSSTCCVSMAPLAIRDSSCSTGSKATPALTILAACC